MDPAAGQDPRQGAAERLSFLPWIEWSDYWSMLIGGKLGPVWLPGIVILGIPAHLFLRQRYPSLWAYLAIWFLTDLIGDLLLWILAIRELRSKKLLQGLRPTLRPDGLEGGIDLGSALGPRQAGHPPRPEAREDRHPDPA